MSTLLYGCEAWAFYRHNIRTLANFACAACVKSPTSDGRRMYLRQWCYKNAVLSVLKHLLSPHNCVAWATLPVGRTTESQSRFSMVNCHLVSVDWAVPCCATITVDDVKLVKQHFIRDSSHVISVDKAAVVALDLHHAYAHTDDEIRRVDGSVHWFHIFQTRYTNCSKKATARAVKNKTIKKRNASSFYHIPSHGSTYATYPFTYKPSYKHHITSLKSMRLLSLP